MMRLADFIRSDMEAIISGWEAFAATCLPAGARMGSSALRDHAREILEAVAKDLKTFQSSADQAEKSMGRGQRLMDTPHTAAQTHATLRARSGFDINQLAAEYRALRASVLRQWMNACLPEEPHVEDIIRFNEAIDQALAESISIFSAEVEQSRNLLLGMLGHDMRSPLQIMLLAGRQLAASNAEPEMSEAASLLIKSGDRMKFLLDDLTDFNRIKLGMAIDVCRSDVDLAALFGDQLQRLRAIHPGRTLELKVVGDSRAAIDAERMQRLLENLVVNAMKYGRRDTPVVVFVEGDDADVRFEVRNAGDPIEPYLLHQIFDPLRRGPEYEATYGADGSLGLGLYIAREIAKAHGGEIEARSENDETVFAVRFPRTLIASAPW
jgi:signal transduction histidine kinase